MSCNFFQYVVRKIKGNLLCLFWTESNKKITKNLILCHKFNEIGKIQFEKEWTKFSLDLQILWNMILINLWSIYVKYWLCGRIMSPNITVRLKKKETMVKVRICEYSGLINIALIFSKDSGLLRTGQDWNL